MRVFAHIVGQQALARLDHPADDTLVHRLPIRVGGYILETAGHCLHHQFVTAIVHQEQSHVVVVEVPLDSPGDFIHHLVQIENRSCQPPHFVDERQLGISFLGQRIEGGQLAVALFDSLCRSRLLLRQYPPALEPNQKKHSNHDDTDGIHSRYLVLYRPVNLPRQQTD